MKVMLRFHMPRSANSLDLRKKRKRIWICVKLSSPLPRREGDGKRVKREGMIVNSKITLTTVKH